MGGKLNVYNLGEKGVNVTKTPLHHEDGEFLSAQNAEFYAEAGLGGLRKRPGLQRFNTDVMASAVKGVIGVPLPSPAERAVHVAPGRSVANFYVATDGITWDLAEGVNDQDQIDTDQGGTYLYDHQKAAHLLGQFFYAGRAGGFDPNGTPAVFGFDGEMSYELARFSGAVGSALIVCGTHNDQVIVGEYDTANFYVWLVDPVTGEKRQVGDAATLAGANVSAITAGCSFLGKVWIGVQALAGALIYYAREGDTTWTLDRTSANMVAPTTMLPYQGALYVGYGTVNPNFALLEKRTSAGVWSTERTGDTNTMTNRWDGLTKHLAKLYVAYDAIGLVGVDPKKCEIHENDAGSWSISKDFDTSESAYRTGGLLSVGQALYVSIFDDGITTTPRGIWRKVGAGAWTHVNSTIAFDQYGGMLAVV